MSSDYKPGSIGGSSSASATVHVPMGSAGPPSQAHQRGNNATFSGMTAMIGVLALIADILSVAVPHWGYYSPSGPAFYQTGQSAALAVVVVGSVVVAVAVAVAVAVDAVVPVVAISCC